METVTDYKRQILEALNNRQISGGKRYLVVKDWCGGYFYGLWDGYDVDTKVLKDLRSADRKLFAHAVETMVKEGVLCQYEALTTEWDGCTLNTFFGFPELEHQFMPNRRPSHSTGIMMNV